MKYLPAIAGVVFIGIVVALIVGPPIVRTVFVVVWVVLFVLGVVPLSIGLIGYTLDERKKERQYQQERRIEQVAQTHRQRIDALSDAAIRLAKEYNERHR